MSLFGSNLVAIATILKANFAAKVQKICDSCKKNLRFYTK